jgi:thiosulfate dehydrogenase (quinone) large subunit
MYESMKTFIMKVWKHIFSSNGSSPELAGMLLQISFGVFFLIAGLNKILGIGAANFVANMSTGFETTFLPMILVTTVLWIIPFAEVIIGAWLITGWKKNLAAWSAGKLLILFIIGHGVKMEYSAISDLFVYLLALTAIIALPSMYLKK